MSPGVVAATLTSALVALKLTGVIGWSWWLVFTPEIVYVALAVTVYAFARAIVSRLMKKNAAEIARMMRDVE